MVRFGAGREAKKWRAVQDREATRTRRVRQALSKFQYSVTSLATLPRPRTSDDIVHVLQLLARLDWVNLSGFVLPALLLTWLDRRSGRRIS